MPACVACDTTAKGALFEHRSLPSPTMRINYNTCVVGEKALLVPYRREHVPLYNQWMQDPSLQAATASEPLTLEQEYQMQESWANDGDKCTFIILDRGFDGVHGTSGHRGEMVGDCNLFFNDFDDRCTAEIEVMVAETKSRQKGLAREALGLLMAYAVKHLQVRRFLAKVGENNVASLNLFDRLSYRKVSYSQFFHEHTLELCITAMEPAWLHALACGLKVEQYDVAYEDKT